MLEYDVETKTMKSESSEPVAFFITMFIVIVWALITCVLSRAQTRWMPLLVLAIAIARTMLFVADKSYTAVTVNGKVFAQATLQFYVSALHVTTMNKVDWRDKYQEKKQLFMPKQG
jgi:hypothetical protein